VPTIQIKSDDIYIKTPLSQYALGLFSYCRIVHICNYREIVEIKNKKWWRWQSPIRINFSKIDYIDLTYPRLPEHDKDNPDEIYDLFLITKDPFSRIFLFRFGSIGFTSLTVQETAKNCVNLITKYTNIRFGPKLKDMPLSDFKDKYICKACGHRLHPDSEFILCPYCGGKEIRIEGINVNNTEIITGRDIKEKEAKAKVKEMAPINRERFKVKESALLMIKISGIGLIFLGVILFLFRHSVPAGVEAAVGIAIILPISGIVIFLVGMKREKYFIEISREGINVNNTKIITWRNIKEVKIKNLDKNCSYWGKQIEIFHFDRKGKKRITSSPPLLKEVEKLYEVIKNQIESYPKTEGEYHWWWRLRYLPEPHIIRSYLYFLVLFVGLSIYMYKTSPQTISKNERINKNISTNPQTTNKNVPKPQAHEHLNAAYNFYKQGDFLNALAEYNKAIENDPNNNQAYYNRGVTFLKTGENDKALSDFKRSIELDPHHFQSYRNLDWVLFKQREWETIINYWSEFIQLEPEHAQAYLERGGAYYHQGNWDAALKDVKESCDLGNSEGCMRYKQLKEKMGN